MDRNGCLTLILFIFVVSDCSSAYAIWGFRNLLSGSPKDMSPLASPVTRDRDSKAAPITTYKSAEKKTNNSQTSNNTRKEILKGLNKDDGNIASVSPPPPDVKDNEKGRGRQEKVDNKTDPQLQSNLNCKGSTQKCSFNGTVIACIHGIESGNNKPILLVQNDGGSHVELNVTVSTSLNTNTSMVGIPEHKTRNISISRAIGQSTKLLLRAGNEECSLLLDPTLSGGNFLQQLPSYYKQVTPIYVAYFLFLIALVVGGTCACCQFRKRRRQEGVPYQELEMGSASALNVETAEGWDAGWDDDWDEEMAVKSPGGLHTANISVNGLTARSSHRDGWEKDWDD